MSPSVLNYYKSKSELEEFVDGSKDPAVAVDPEAPPAVAASDHCDRPPPHPETRLNNRADPQ